MLKDGEALESTGYTQADRRVGFSPFARLRPYNPAKSSESSALSTIRLSGVSPT